MQWLANLTNNARIAIYPYIPFVYTYILSTLYKNHAVAHVTLAHVLSYSIATDLNKFKEMKNNCLQLIAIFVCSFSAFQFRTDLSWKYVNRHL